MRVLLFLILSCQTLGAATLCEYAHCASTSYEWTWIQEEVEALTTVHTLHLVSQSWRSSQEVNQPVWEHWLTIVRPHNLQTQRALLFIHGGNRPDSELPFILLELRQLAEATGACVIQVTAIPNQPLVFAKETDPRYVDIGRCEDQLLAFSWDRYLQTKDPTWIAQLPMTRSVVAAMDAVQEFTSGEVEDFIITGGSKRGWTAWLAAAIDSRVAGVAPCVIDLLNIKPSMEHHQAAYGCFSPPLQDYIEMGIFDEWESPDLADLFALIDPYNYRDLLTMPKMMIHAAGDEFFLPDSAQFYFDKLLGPRYLRYIPNTGHRLRDTDAFATIAAFFSASIQEISLPECHWELAESGLLTVSTDTCPQSVRLWSAHNPNARDFRMHTLGPVWISQELPVSTSLSASLDLPDQGWSAYFMELTFEGPGGMPFTQTTEVFVLPTTLPYRQ